MKKVLKKQRGNKKGFTLVEMIVVIAIIGVLAAMMVPSLLGYIDKANTSNNRAAAANIGRAAQAILVELNDVEVGKTKTTFFASPKENGKENGIIVTGDPAIVEKSKEEKFSKALGDMYKNEKFDGYFTVQVEGGKLISAYYSKTTPLTEDTATGDQSTESIGVYPEK